MKRCFGLILALLLLLVIAFPGGAHATTPSGVTIEHNYVRIREQASTTSTILATVMTGTTYTYLATTDKDSAGYPWYQLQYSPSQVGYVRSDLARLNYTNTETALGEVVVNSGDGLNVRTGPSVSYSLIGHLANGTAVSYYGSQSGWYKIWYNGQYAWISGYYTVAKTSVPTAPTDPIAELTVVNAPYGLNVRTGPSTGYLKIGTLANGTVLKYYSVQNNWYQIIYLNQTAWISGTYVSLSTFTPGSPLGELVVRSADGLNVRTGPSVNYTRLGMVADGSVHKYYATQNNWYQIVFQNQYAWVSGYYVSLGGATPPAPPVNTKYIAITFDDGPSVYTPGLLDGLKARGVKSTFFVVGYNVDRFPSTIQRMDAEGHEVANHTNGHYQLTSYSYSTILSQITRLDAKVSSLIGKTPQYLRPPYGALNTSVMNAAAETGKAVITWSVDPRDWDDRVASTVTSRIVNNAFAGAIVLVHDLYPTSIRGALAAIDQLKARGYQCVTLSQLFAVYGKKPLAGQRYNALRY